ncbi:MAG: hypothetical protein CW346_15240 [Bacillaceae bacterium]|nr:hypothetical protein [Bacillaceae bacterium]
MTYTVHTSNRGWLAEPNPFRHIRPTVAVQYDSALADDTYRLYYGDTPIDKVRPIGERSCSEIRRRVQEHAATRAEEVAPQVQAGEGGQMVLVL